MNNSLLTPYRVLDLSDENGLVCGRTLAEMGADTIVIEPPSGNKVRQKGPFYQNMPDQKQSHLWHVLNYNKRSITLNLESTEGGNLFKQLVKTAHIVIESFPPGLMENLGLGYRILSELNPGLVMTSITPFGSEGPYSNYKASDIVIMGLGGLSNISGEPDREPLTIPVPQSIFYSGNWAAAATMIALFHSQSTGEGQHVDCPMQLAATWASYSSQEWWSYAGINLKREGTWRQFGLSRIQVLFPCLDGHVMLFILGGSSAAPGQKLLLEWMEKENKCPDSLRGFDFSKLDVALASQDFFNELSNSIATFFITKSKSDLFEWAHKNILFLAPVNNAEDLLNNPQLKHRDFWIDLEHPDLGISLKYPGPPAILSETSIKINSRAPLLGEHNNEIYGDEFRLSEDEIQTLVHEGII